MAVAVQGWAWSCLSNAVLCGAGEGAGVSAGVGLHTVLCRGRAEAEALSCWVQEMLSVLLVRRRHGPRRPVERGMGRGWL